MDFRTPKQRVKDARNYKIATRYDALTEEYPNTKRTPIIAHIAKEMNLSPYTIREVLIKAGRIKDATPRS